MVATVVVMACYVAAAIVLNLLVSNRLTSQVDTRLSSGLSGQLADLSRPVAHLPGAPQAPTDDDHDIDDAPTFFWTVSRTGSPTALTDGGPRLPHRSWAGTPTTLLVGGTPFRFLATRWRDGWLVAGESAAQLDRVRSALVGPELLFGGALALVVFVGSLAIGLRASAPLELVHRRQVEFTADASHKLRTPLSVIEAEVDLALRRPRTPSEYEEVLGRIGGEGRRLRQIVGDLLWLARVDDEESAHPDVTEMDVADTAEHCAARFQPVALARGVDLRVETGDGPTWIRADPGLIDRLVGVLVDNACKYAGAGGRAVVRIHAVGTRVVLQVDDSGPGIPVEERPLVLDRFHRGTDDSGGTGLGLAIADTVVRATGGTWSIGRSPFGGARMQVWWKKAAVRRDTAPVAAAEDPLATST